MPLDVFPADEWLVIFELSNAIARHSFNESFVHPDTLASSANGDYF